jgi:hypothetical protein
MLDLEVTHEVADAIESLRPSRHLTIEDCTTPELRLEYIAQWLEAGAPHRYGVVGFDMSDVENETNCGTVCCIAGAARMFFGKENVAADTIGLKFPHAQMMFIPPHWNVPSRYSPAWAARCIRHYQKTGIVDWEGTR